MTRFEDFKYQRPDIQALTKDFDQSLADFEAAKSLQDQSSAFEKMNALREEFSTMYNLCYVRHKANTKDRFYEKENAYFDESSPTFDALNNRYYKALLASKFRKELEQQFGDYVFTIAELSLKTFKPTILDDLVKENELRSEYDKIKAQAKITFKGERYNLSSIHPLELSDDRKMR